MFRKCLIVAGLMFATISLSGCIVEAPDHHHRPWGWWHHHDDR